MPKVSVILTSGNRESYIREAIDSVLGQTFADFELIIWDDASKDGSWAVIGSYADPRIKRYRNEVPRGATYGLNKAISDVVAGEYVAVLRADDVWLPAKLESQVAILDTHPETGAAFAQAVAIGPDSLPLDESGHAQSGIIDHPNRTRHEWLNYFFYQGNPLCHSSVLIRRHCYQDCGGYRNGLEQLADLELWVRLCLRHEVHVLPEYLVKVRARAATPNVDWSRPGVRIRRAAEYNALLRIFLSLRSLPELQAIFPQAEKYLGNPREKSVPHFVLAMLLLDRKLHPYHWQLGLEILFDQLGDEVQAAELSAIHGFDRLDLAHLAGKYDVFSVEVTDQIRRNLSACERQIEARDHDIKALKDSASWRVTAPLRFAGRQVRRARYLAAALVDGWGRVSGRALGLLSFKSSEKGSSDLMPTAAEKSVAGRARILFVSHEASRTGAPMFLLRLMHYISTYSRIEFEVLLCSGGELVSEFCSLGPTTVLPNGKALTKQMVASLRSRGIDLVYSNTITNGHVQAKLALLNCPILCHVHELEDSIMRFFGGKNLELVKATTSVYLGGSGAVVRSLVEHFGIPPDKVVLAYPFVSVADNERHALAGSGPAVIPKDAFVVGGCGTVNWRKAPDLFIALAKLVKERSRRPVYFVWVGGPLAGEESEKLLRSAREGAVPEYMHFAGHAHNHLDYFAQFDAFALTSREDPFPLVALDAASLGKPVVCFADAGGTPEMIGEADGCVVPYLDVSAMADALVRLVEDKKVYQQVSENVKARILENFDEHQGGWKIVSLINEFAAKGT